VTVGQTATATGQATGPLLELRDLSTSLPGDTGAVRIVDGVSLTLERGRTLAVVGESGSGKTMLVRSIMGLLPGGAERTGTLRFGDRDLLGASRAELRHLWGTQMAMVFQDPMTALNPVVRIARQITEKLRAHEGLGKREAAGRAAELLGAVGIDDPGRRLRQYPHELSGGMRQRVVIAMAIAGDPELLLADEPTTALDVTVQAQILDLLASLIEERDMALILVSHNLAVVAGCADEVAVMYAGRIVERAPTRELFARPRMPYTRALLGAIPRSGLARHTRLAAIPGRPPGPGAPLQGCPYADRCPLVEDRCRHAPPPLEPVAPGHDVACWVVG
jgi:oligopeptide/dipeptide ABC transporter ATP-binding protein